MSGVRYRIRRPDGTLTAAVTEERAREIVGRMFDKAEPGDKFAIRVVYLVPQPPLTATEPVKKIWSALYRKFPALESWGVYNCRTVAGSTTWSQHAWGNALDYHGTPTAMLDAARWLVREAKAARLPVAKIILAGRVWKPTTGWVKADGIGHYDHAHVEGKPTKSGVPPCA